jgi:hypothetical protein
MSPYGNSHIGIIDGSKPVDLVLDDLTYSDIENDVKRVINNELDKTSALLYGPPGNGKSRFIRYISQKYEFTIYKFYFNPDYTNVDILEAFNKVIAAPEPVTGPDIVVAVIFPVIFTFPLTVALPTKLNVPVTYKF